MKLKWPWQKNYPEPDVGIYIDYYQDTNTLKLYCYPPDMEREEVLSFMDHAAELIEADIEREEAERERQGTGQDGVKQLGHLRLVKK